MTLFAQFVRNAGDLDLADLAAQVGLTPGQLNAGGGALLGKLACEGLEPGEAASYAEAVTGVPADKLLALLPALATALGVADHSDDPVGGLLEKLGGADGILGSLGQLFGKR